MTEQEHRWQCTAWFVRVPVQALCYQTGGAMQVLQQESTTLRVIAINKSLHRPPLMTWAPVVGSACPLEDKCHAHHRHLPLERDSLKFLKTIVHGSHRDRWYCQQHNYPKISENFHTIQVKLLWTWRQAVDSHSHGCVLPLPSVWCIQDLRLWPSFVALLLINPRHR
jgi:hypothetical protein